MATPIDLALELAAVARTIRRRPVRAALLRAARCLRDLSRPAPVQLPADEAEARTRFVDACASACAIGVSGSDLALWFEDTWAQREARADELRRRR
jgi:hypothetical protein